MKRFLTAASLWISCVGEFNCGFHFCNCLSVFTITTSAEEWTVKVAKELDALVSSCVVIPCSFTHPYGNLPTSRLKGTWYLPNDKKPHVYDEDDDDIMEKFRDRTKLLGQLGQRNCTLEITDIKDHDNGPFCLEIGILQAEAKKNEVHSFVDNCVQFKMIRMLPNVQNFTNIFHIFSNTKPPRLTFTLFTANPPKPKVTQPKVASEDHPYIVTCSVTHTCPSPSHRPNLTWSRGEEGEISEVHRELHLGNWEVMSILTFMPKDKDDHSELKCTANFDGGMMSSATVTVYLKREIFSLLCLQTSLAV